MNSLIHRTFLALCSLVMTGFVLAQDDPFGPIGAAAGNKAAEVVSSLVTDATAIAPGTDFTVAVKFDHQLGWHTYWKNPGGVQLSPKFAWTLPEGFKASEPEFPTPELVEEKPFRNYAYSGTSYVFFKITPPANLAASGSSEISLKPTFQFCKADTCKPCLPTLRHSLTLPHAAAAASDAAQSKVLADFRTKHLPTPLADFKATAYQTAPNAFALHFQGQTAVPTEAHFLCDVKDIIDAPAAQTIVKTDDGFVLKVKGPAIDPEDKEPRPEIKQLSGILKIGEKGYTLSVPVSKETPPVPLEPQEPLGKILWLAFVGGMILNLMPCVFPVIGIKIMDFVRQSGQDPWKVKLHGIVFSLGILVTFLLLAWVTIALKGSWGFQLQDPWVVYVLMLIMFVFAMNMYGVFEIGTSVAGVGQELTAKKGYLGSFFKGALAVVVSTPCSAPYLATALSAVLTLPKAQIVLVYTFIALGLSFPYLVLTSSPALLKKLPKPGAWMEAFKQIMSFLMFGTAGFLLWTFQGLLKDDEFDQLLAILSLAIIGLGLYMHGRWNNLLHEKKIRLISGVLALACVVGGFLLGAPSTGAKLTWQPWTPELEAKLVEEGKPVYIDFTARWCATCQSNKVSYKTAAIKAAVAKKGIQLLKADWTDQNATIRNELETKYGSNGIPVNVLLIPDQDKPEVLPKILTPDVVLEYFGKLPDAEADTKAEVKAEVEVK